MAKEPETGEFYIEAYASLSATITLFQTILNQVIPLQIQNYIVSKILSYFRPHSSNITLAIEEKEGVVTNEVYATAEIYLSAKTAPNFNVSKRPKDPKVNVKFANCWKITDSFEGIELVWRFVHDTEKKTMTKYEYDTGMFPNEKRYFELSFNKQYKDKIMNRYIPFVLNKAKDMFHEKKVVKLHSLANILTYNSKPWDSVNLEHPSTFDTLALEPALKKSIIEDLDRFLKRKDLLKFGKFFVPHR
uniref:AAA-ATPase At5g17760-like n=2 Tax=Nicotiana TaxID=4085 RepID=A0A1S3ZTE2_TOBAC